MNDAEEMLYAAVRCGPWPIGALKEILADAGVSEWHMRRAAQSLTQSGELKIVTQKFWTSPAFFVENRHRNLYLSGNSRSELIARFPAPREPVSAPTITQQIMEGDDAERQAREAFARERWREQGLAA